MNGHEPCQAYADHLLAEHRQLHSFVRRLQTNLNQLTEKTLDAPLRKRLLAAGESLKEELKRHFAEEEEGGCLDYAVSRVPSLAPEAAALESEHPQLLVELERVLEPLRGDKAGKVTLGDVQNAFNAFVLRLLKHEARENRIVQRGLNVNWEE